MRTVRVVLFVAAVIILSVCLWVFWPRGERPSAPAAGFTSDGFKRVPVIEDEYTVLERLNPLHAKTRAEELLADKPPGTEVYEFEIAEPGIERVWRSPEGAIYVETDTGLSKVVAYSKPEPRAALELRPKGLLFTDLSSVGVGAGLDVVRLGRVHMGPAAGYSTERSGWAGGSVSYNVWRNCDVGAYAGKALGDRGWTGGVSVAVAVE